jgi:glycosyltransferase involved in cell wall biosynthesis
MKVSIVIPVFNAAKSIALLVGEIKKELISLYEVEIVLVNDCSKDTSESICEELAGKDKEIKFISLRKNSGEHNAVICGLHYTTGDYTVIIDDDFQNPPSEINKLLNEIRNKQCDVVYSRYEQKKHSLFRNLGSKFSNTVASYLLNKPKNLYLSSFKVIHKDIVKEIIKYSGPYPYIDGLILRVTDNIGTQLVKHSPRMEGKSNYTLKKLISLYLNMLLNFSVKPLRLFTLLGFAIFILGILLSISVMIEKFLYNTPPGWTFNAVIILTFSGFQVMFMGVLGEYLGKLFLSQNGTPQFTVKKTIINSDKESSHA